MFSRHAFLRHVNRFWYLENSYLPVRSTFQVHNSLANRENANFHSSNRLFELLAKYPTSDKAKSGNETIYHGILSELYKRRRQMSNHEIIKLLNYITLSNSTFIKDHMFQHCLKTLNKNMNNSLESEDIQSLCQSVCRSHNFNNSFKIRKEIKHHLYQNLSILKNGELFTSLIKYFTKHREQDEELLCTLSNTICFNGTANYYNFSTLSHIMELYSDYLFNDLPLVDHLSEKAIKLLKCYLNQKSMNVSQTVINDITRFLKALSHLNYDKLQYNDIKTVIVPVLHRLSKYNENCASLFPILLYLWMLNYRDHDLISLVFSVMHTKINVLGFTGEVFNLTNLLIQCIYIEDRDLFTRLGLKLISNASERISKNVLNRRQALIDVYATLARIPKEDNSINFELSYAIPYLNIVGITGYRNHAKNIIHIEILDETNCFKNADPDIYSVCGMMALKLRLLNQMKPAVIVLEKTEVDSISPKHLKKLLTNELKFLCI